MLRSVSSHFLSLAVISLFVLHLVLVCSLQIITEVPAAFSASDPREPKFVVSLNSQAPGDAVNMGLEHGVYRTMKDKRGRYFSCHMPEVDGTASHPLAKAADVSASTPSKTPFELLDALTALCLYRQEGLWTYEMCYKKHTRQFRQVGSQDANAKAEDFSCGKYNGDEVQLEDIRDDSSTSNVPVRYVSHTFSGGAKCIMTGEDRSTEVRFTCLPEAVDNMIVAVKEFPTCQYIFTVATPFLCKHPAFAHSPEKSYNIVCNPTAGMYPVEHSTDTKADSKAAQQTFNEDSVLTSQQGSQAESSDGAQSDVPNLEEHEEL